MSEISKQTNAKLTPLTALGELQPLSENFGNISLTEVADIALATFSARDQQQERASRFLENYTGAEAPGPGRMTFGEVECFWLAPAQWMLMADFESHSAMPVDLAMQTRGFASITEQTDGWCRFDLTGAELCDVFERLCAIPVRSWSGGEATRTIIHHIGCYVLCRSSEHMSVLGPRSSAQSLHHALQAAIKAVL